MSDIRINADTDSSVPSSVAVTKAIKLLWQTVGCTDIAAHHWRKLAGELMTAAFQADGFWLLCERSFVSWKEPWWLFNAHFYSLDSSEPANTHHYYQSSLRENQRFKCTHRPNYRVKAFVAFIQRKWVGYHLIKLTNLSFLFVFVFFMNAALTHVGHSQHSKNILLCSLQLLIIFVYFLEHTALTDIPPCSGDTTH